MQTKSSLSTYRPWRRAALLGGISALALTVAGGPVAAQQGAVLEEIVVTAQKREQTLQDVSAAVSAVDGIRLQESQIHDLEDLQLIMPSIYIGNDFNMAKLFIRGVGGNTSTTGSETGVAFHVDGAVVARAEAQLTSLFDIERLEVVRGPQGTLYGRNAVGGSVNVITAKPTEDFEGYGRLTMGNYSNVIAEGAVSGPISDKILGRVAFKSEDRGGFGENPVTSGEVDGRNRQMVRAHLEFRPTDRISYLVTGEWFNQDDSSGAIKFRRQTFVGENFEPVLNDLGEGGYATDPRGLASEFDPRTDTNTWAITGTLDWILNDRLTLTNITNYRDFETSITQDLDMSAVINSLENTGNSTTVQRRDVNSEQFSNELRFNYTANWLDGVLGVFFFRENQRPVDTVGLGPVLGQQQNIDVFNTAPTVVGPPATLDEFHNLCDTAKHISDGIEGMDPLPPKRVCIKSDLDTTAWAIFGQATIQLGAFAQGLDTVALKLGGRYSWEERQTANPAIIMAGGGAGPIIHYTTDATFNERTFKDFTPEIGLEWRPIEDVMFYYTYAEGFKAGAGENSAGSSTIVDPEKLDSHEIGMKSTFWGGRATASVAAFTYDLKGLQINRTFSGGPAGFSTSFENAAQTSAEGIEVELAAQITNQFRVNGALSYLDSEFDDFLTKDPFKAENIGTPGNPQFDPTLPPEQLAGNPTRNSPEWAANLHAEYDIMGIDLPYNGFLTVSGDMSYKSKIFFTEFHRLIEGSRAYTMFDAALRYTSASDRFTASVWVKNLTDKFRPTSTFAVSTSRSVGATYLAPRTWGATIGYRF